MKLIIIIFLSILLLFTCSVGMNAQNKERKGQTAELTIGPGFTIINSSSGTYSITGLYLVCGAGVFLNQNSRLMALFKFNLFPREIGAAWSNWTDKMRGDDLSALLAILASPFVYAFTPFFRGHNLMMALDYTYFFNKNSPSLFLSGSMGLSFLYKTSDKQVNAGIGLAGGIGYEFRRHIAISSDVILFTTPLSDAVALSVSVGIKYIPY